MNMNIRATNHGSSNYTIKSFLDASYLSYTHSAYIHTYIASGLDASYLSYTHSACHVVADHVHANTY